MSRLITCITDDRAEGPEPINKMRGSTVRWIAQVENIKLANRSETQTVKLCNSRNPFTRATNADQVGDDQVTADLIYLSLKKGAFRRDLLHPPRAA